MAFVISVRRNKDNKPNMKTCISRPPEFHTEGFCGGCYVHLWAEPTKEKKKSRKKSDYFCGSVKPGSKRSDPCRCQLTLGHSGLHRCFCKEQWGAEKRKYGLRMRNIKTYIFDAHGMMPPAYLAHVGQEVKLIGKTRDGLLRVKGKDGLIMIAYPDDLKVKKK